MSGMLSLRDAELVEKLTEEAAEVIQAGMKAARFGWHGSYDSGVSNVDQLETEIGDFSAVLRILCDAGVLSERRIAEYGRVHRQKLQSSRYMLHLFDPPSRKGVLAVGLYGMPSSPDKFELAGLHATIFSQLANDSSSCSECKRVMGDFHTLECSKNPPFGTIDSRVR